MVLSNATDGSLNRAPRFSPQPLDRIAAFIIDAMILSSLLSLVTAWPLRALREAMLVEDWFMILVSLTVMGLFFVSGAIFYEVLGLRFFCTTFGRRIYGLEVRDATTKKPLSISVAFLRTVSRWVEVVLGWPALAIFLRADRKPFHDRFCQSEVDYRRPLPLRARYVSEPDVVEFKIGKSLGLFIIVFWLSFLASVVDVCERHHLPQTVQAFFAELKEKDDDSMCEAVTTTLERTHLTDDRLDLAIALKTMDTIDSECLKQEIENALKQDYESSAVRFAQAMAEDGELADFYLLSVCEEDSSSEYCKAQKIISAWRDKKIGEAQKEIERSNSSSLIMRVLTALQGLKSKDFKLTEAALAPLWQDPGFVPAVTELKMLSLWGLGERKTAEELFQASLAFSSSATSAQQSYQMCQLELQEGCPTQLSHSCGYLISNMQTLAFHGKPLSALIDLAMCGNPQAQKTIENESLIVQPNWLELLKAYQYQLKGDIKTATKMYDRILRDSESLNWMKAESRLRLFSLSNESAGESKFYKAWLKQDPLSWDWRRQGWTLLKKAFLEKDYLLSLSIAEKLIKIEPNNNRLQDVQIIAELGIGKSPHSKNLKSLVEGKMRDQRREFRREVASASQNVEPLSSKTQLKQRESELREVFGEKK